MYGFLAHPVLHWSYRISGVGLHVDVHILLCFYAIVYYVLHCFRFRCALIGWWCERCWTLWCDSVTYCVCESSASQLRYYYFINALRCFISAWCTVWYLKQRFSLFPHFLTYLAEWEWSSSFASTVRLQSAGCDCSEHWHEWERSFCCCPALTHHATRIRSVERGICPIAAVCTALLSRSRDPCHITFFSNF